LRRASIKFSYAIFDEKKEKLLVEGESVHACINKQGKIMRVPADIAEKIDPQR